MKYSRIILTSITAFVAFFTAVAKEDVVPQVHRDIHKALQQEMESSQRFQAMVDSASNAQGIMEVFELAPALNIYPEWNNNFNPVASGKTIPNTTDIDLRGFVAPIVGRITSPYGWRWRRMHKGEDIALHIGDTVRAAFDGKVRIKNYERRGYGYYYVIRHDNGLETIYGHLSRQLVPEGKDVKAGEPIGLGGSTGRSTGPHLHFETRFMGIALDPAELIDFNTFKPKMDVYHFDKSRAERAQAGNGRQQATAITKTNRVTPAASNGGKKYHKVKKGDTLSAIARRYGTSVSRICQLNGFKANKKLSIGQSIRYK